MNVFFRKHLQIFLDEVENSNKKRLFLFKYKNSDRITGTSYFCFSLSLTKFEIKKRK